MRELLKARLSPFRNRDFTRFFIAQGLSMIGTWSHDLARSWIIVQMTGSSGALGNLNMAIAVPCLFLILQGGVFVDRTDVRKLIQWTKSMLGIACIVLAALSEWSHLHMWQFMVFGIVEGLITSFDQPAFQSLTVRLVPRSDFQQAIALNSMNFHTSRMLGPIIATWLMFIHGPSFVFLFDGLTYFVVALVLIGTKLQHVPRTVEIGLAGNGCRSGGLREGLRYIWAAKRLRIRVLQLMLTLSCIYPITYAVFRVFVQKKFSLDANQFGAVFSFMAMGSMAGALSFAVIKPQRPTRALFLGVPLVFFCLIAIPWIPDLHLATLIMTLAGFGLYLSFASLTIAMHLEVLEEYRGRMSSVIGLGFTAVGPLMCFPWGHFADAVGAQQTIHLASIIFGVGSAGFGWFNHRLDKAEGPPSS